MTTTTPDLSTLVAAYIELGDGFDAMLAEGVLSPEQGEGWTACRDQIRDIAEEAHGMDEFVVEYQRQNRVKS